ncbi:MAPEG family protein [Cognatilysobacter lacus]|uniref:MAPEG family protein n=1 Tax=Cognatilysobacter lacus TaxID=1643323 RepID=A0A5D8Z659_9GAMM|nr:MAPEG family protein [Lysobacter lacus]TZF90140.1 MAPEG family protein [Lysobacter lacus]
MPFVTLLIAGFHGLLLLMLLVPIVAARRGKRIGLGDGGDPLLLRRIRVHANFIEYVPFVLLLIALLEMTGLGRGWVALLGGALLVARVLHAIGLSGSAGVSFGRFWGTLLTWCVILAASVIAIVRAAESLTLHA